MESPKMAETYTTLGKEGSGEYTEKKSVFIGHALPCKREEDAIEYIAAMRKKYSDARHNVYAYVLSDGNFMRYSDDAEPQGTAGLPVLDVIRKSGFTDAVIVVTRYFGGTLLGTGGLVRAYTAAAKAAVEDAGIVTYRSFTVLSLRCDYADYGKISSVASAFSFETEDTVFADVVCWRLAVLSTEADRFETKVCETTGGRVVPVKIGFRYGAPMKATV